MDRVSYFESISLVKSPLLILNDINQVIKAREIDSEESLGIYLSVAEYLESLNNDAARTRGAFIRLQCKGIDTKDLFEEYCESWGIPKFDENLVSFDDFKYGFLWTFRDHTTSWAEDVEARNWFYNHVEARFVRRYEFYSCDRGPEELLLIESGDFKSILQLLIEKHEDYSPLVSSIFSKVELETFYSNFDETLLDFSKDYLLEILQQNPNWQSENLRTT